LAMMSSPLMICSTLEGMVTSFLGWMPMNPL
jgi:hypothetical protein